jgi:hypothetical protein
MIAMLVDVAGIILLLGGLIFDFIMFLVEMCKKKEVQEEDGKKVEVVVEAGDQKNHGESA